MFEGVTKSKNKKILEKLRNSEIFKKPKNLKNSYFFQISEQNDRS